MAGEDLFPDSITQKDRTMQGRTAQWSRTVRGHSAFEVVSAMQKAIRAGDEEDALYWAFEMMESGHVGWMWNRLCIIAAEDIGLADTETFRTVVSARQAHAAVSPSKKEVKGRNIVALAILAMCRAPKNREADDAAYWMEMEREENQAPRPIPERAQDGHTSAGKAKLQQIAKKKGIDFLTVWSDEFFDYVGSGTKRFGGAGLVRNKVEVEKDDGVPDRGVDWSLRLVEKCCTETAIARWKQHRGDMDVAEGID